MQKKKNFHFSSLRLLDLQREKAISFDKVKHASGFQPWCQSIPALAYFKIFPS